MARYDSDIWYGAGMEDGDSDVTFGPGVIGQGRLYPDGRAGRPRSRRGGAPARRGRLQRRRRQAFQRTREEMRDPLDLRFHLRGRWDRTAGNPRANGSDEAYDLPLLDHQNPMIREMREETSSFVTDFLREERPDDSYTRSMGLNSRGRGNRLRRAVRRAFRRPPDR